MGASSRRNNMFRRTRLQMMAVLAIGALIGYLAATGGLNPFHRASAAPAVAEGTAAAPGQAACCDGVDKAQVLAAVNAHNAHVFATAAQNGKKPNILFIMGD